MNWHDIRPINSSQREGFEELCSQLARLESPSDSKFVRKGTPDAGIECYCSLPNGDEWGWQAKFVFELGESQWQQIDDSVKRALEKHPRLTRFFVCVPMDRADGRIRGRKSAMDRWNDRVDRKWAQWAEKLGMEVEFVWWGDSELIDRLSQDEHTGRRLFWFEQRSLDRDWFQRRIDEAVADAGPRYTPDNNVELPITKDLERFSRSERLFDDIKSLAIGMRKASDGLKFAKASLGSSIDLTDIDRLICAVSRVIGDIRAVEPCPEGSLPFVEISQAAEVVAQDAQKVLFELLEQQQKVVERSTTSIDRGRSLREVYNDCVYYLRSLVSELDRVVDECIDADNLAGRQVLIVKGDAGVGKTHLLCDFTEARTALKLPTVLLLGHRFRGSDDPWNRLLEILDLNSISADEFIGYLEAAAQAANNRALLIVDALNEGNGREIWPDGLASFILRLSNSEWIAVVLSVRTGYEEMVIPENIMESAVHLEHHGFAAAEYDAIESYFDHHGIEIQSSPMLEPEFNNPLFLKTICKGLEELGLTRIPLGFHGITATFELYFNAVNDQLAKDLNYDSKANLVRSALDRLASAMIQRETRWLPRKEAIRIVDTLLTKKEFSDSLYSGLVGADVLLEEASRGSDSIGEEVVSIAYDRYADHIIADQLLSDHLKFEDEADTGRAKPKWSMRIMASIGTHSYVPEWCQNLLARFGGLPFLGESREYLTAGLLEALCIQVAEKTGRELVRLDPRAADHPSIGYAYLRSLVWRRIEAFTDETLKVLNELIEAEKVKSNPLDYLLTVCAIPGHFFNADFLDKILANDSMADRDARWTVYIHDSWETKGVVYRLVHWASKIQRDDKIDPAVVDLTATTLAWTLTSSNRFLRDKATKALVALLTGRHDSTMKMLRRFAGVDDLYVRERIYAVAYGVAMRSHEAEEVGKLASLVYDQVFAQGAPPGHILLRDYARGVVERAIYLDANLAIEQRLIRPPYRSQFPNIPSKDCIDEVFHESKDEGSSWESHEWSLGRIRNSVLYDDFYIYVIGKDSPLNWMSIKLNDTPWMSLEDRKKCLLNQLSKDELESWVAYQDAKMAEPIVIALNFVNENRKTVETETKLPEGIDRDDVENAQKHTDQRYAQLTEVLSTEHRNELESILNDEQDWRKRDGPRFNKKLIQRYILGRVVNLGWTSERFGTFDQFIIGHSGRDASKPERIGKKYQWIAYYEILAYVSDHFQYRYPYNDEEDERQYKGPWQEILRDLDPSCTLSAVAGGTSWESHAKSWWVKGTYEEWIPELSHKEWYAVSDDLPKIEHLLVAENPNDDSRWLNVNGSFVWRQPNPADEDPFEKNRREIWIGTTGYFVRKRDVDNFMNWAKTVHFWGRWMPEPSALHPVYLGEYGWSPAYLYFYRDAKDGKDWIGTEEFNRKDCPVKFQIASAEYSADSGGFDCSIDEGFSLGLPHPEFIDHFGLRWFGKDVEFLDAEGNLAAFDPTAQEPGPNATLLREDLLKQYLDDRDLVLCWVVVGEKWITGGDAVNVYHGRSQISGAYRFTEDGPDGFIIAKPDHPPLLP